MGRRESMFFQTNHDPSRFFRAAGCMLDGHIAKDVWDPQSGTDGPVPMLERPRLRPMVITKNHLLNGMRPI